MNHDENLDLIIAGAGPSGLAFALGARDAAERAGRPLRIAVLEADGRVGRIAGVVRVVRSGAGDVLRLQGDAGGKRGGDCAVVAVRDG